VLINYVCKYCYPVSSQIVYILFWQPLSS
jgi:hypothetical protein